MHVCTPPATTVLVHGHIVYTCILLWRLTHPISSTLCGSRLSHCASIGSERVGSKYGVWKHMDFILINLYSEVKHLESKYWYTVMSTSQDKTEWKLIKSHTPFVIFTDVLILCVNKITGYLLILVWPVILILQNRASHKACLFFFYINGYNWSNRIPQGSGFDCLDRKSNTL